MFITYIRRAFIDVWHNRLLNAVATLTITLSVLVTSAFVLFFSNADSLLDNWEKGVRIMVYLKTGVSDIRRSETDARLRQMEGVAQITFISKASAFEQLKKNMWPHSALFDDLEENPLPDAFEIEMFPAFAQMDKIERLAGRLEALPAVEQVEYGRLRLKRFKEIADIFRQGGYALGGLFFLASVCIVANTVRLILYSRREEIEIMGLVGASDSFIRIPFYIESILQGTLGGIAGLAILSGLYFTLKSRSATSFAGDDLHLVFLGSGTCLAVILTSAFVGWLGCYLSLKKFLKN